MAGIRPAFITGSVVKIKLNGKTLAFCTNFACSISVLTQTPKVLGKFEADSVEPLGYLVSGSFSVVRYAKGIKKALGNSVPTDLAANDAGNGVGNWGTMWGGKLGDILARNGIGNDGRAHEALDPSKFSNGTTFDIQVYQKVDAHASGGSGTVSGNGLDILGSILQGGTNTGPGNSPNTDYLGVLNIRNARITQADFGISKRAPAMDHFNFVAIYADGDSWVANGSGQN